MPCLLHLITFNLFMLEAVAEEVKVVFITSLGPYMVLVVAEPDFMPKVGAPVVITIKECGMVVAVEHGLGEHIMDLIPLVCLDRVEEPMEDLVDSTLRVDLIIAIPMLIGAGCIVVVPITPEKDLDRLMVDAVMLGEDLALLDQLVLMQVGAILMVPG